MGARSELLVLGAGSILPRAGYGCSGYALRLAAEPGVTLLDCGPGSIRALGSVGVELEEVRRVVISHFHPDHVLDLFALAFARRNPNFRAAYAIEYVGPVGLKKLLLHPPASLERWTVDPEARIVEVPVDLEGRGEWECGALRWSCASTGHSPEALAWRVDAERNGESVSLAYTGDSGEVPAVAELARGAQCLLSECSFPDGAGTPSHLTPSSAARLAAAARVEKLVLTHFYPNCDPQSAKGVARETFDGEIELAADGSRHALGA